MRRRLLFLSSALALLLGRPATLRGASPLGLPDSRTRSPLCRLAPCAWLGSLRSLASSICKMRWRFLFLSSALAPLLGRPATLRGASPLGLPDSRTRSPLCRLLPEACPAHLRSPPRPFCRLRWG